MKISIVITCYNYGHYLTGAIESALQQTFSDFEIFIIDDGSTDNSEEVANRYLIDSRVNYIKQENGGQAKAKNAGIRLANGELIAFLDADDRWAIDKLQKQVLLFADPDIGVVYSRAKYIDDKGIEIPYQLSSPWLQPKRGKVTEALFMDNFVPFSSSIVRKACLERFGCFDETLRMGIDWDLWLRISTAYTFDFVDEPLFEYRMGHSGQMSKNMEERQRCSDRIMENFLKNFPFAVNKWTVRQAYYYTFCNRGSYFRRVDNRKSYAFLLRAILTMPFKVNAYKEIVKKFFC